jgi:hypothetical protein
MTPLSPDLFARLDESPDDLFYATPRFVTHIDDAAIAAVTQIYREYFPPGGAILDLMSSWISHLPPEIAYKDVVALGMNEEELGANPRATERVVQDLNRDWHLPFVDRRFDGAAVCVSVDYLTRPIEVFRECARVLRRGAPFVITFSNRCFPTKVIAAWRMLDDDGHQQLVARYFVEAGGFGNIEILDRSPGRDGDPLYAVIGLARG